MVPVMDLPLQATLTMNFCPPAVAVSYLQGLCNAEGYLVPRDDISRIYNRTCPVPLMETSSRYSITDAFSVPDLRRTINILELWCSTNVRYRPDGNVPWEHHDFVENAPNPPRLVQFGELTDDDLGRSWMTAGSLTVPTSEIEGQVSESITGHEAEFLSYADSELTRKSVYGIEVISQGHTTRVKKT